MDESVEPRVALEDGSGVKARAAKLPWHKPVLETFGSVASLTRGGGFSLSDGFMTTKMSDERAKEDIVRLASHRLGIGIYAFRYRAEFRADHGHGMQLGVMAQEVEAVCPAAVSLDPDGYRRVDYARLAAAAS